MFSSLFLSPNEDLANRLQPMREREQKNEKIKLKIVVGPQPHGDYGKKPSGKKRRGSSGADREAGEVGTCKYCGKYVPLKSMKYHYVEHNQSNDNPFPGAMLVQENCVSSTILSSPDFKAETLKHSLPGSLRHSLPRRDESSYHSRHHHNDMDDRRQYDTRKMYKQKNKPRVINYVNFFLRFNI